MTSNEHYVGYPPPNAYPGQQAPFTTPAPQTGYPHVTYPAPALYPPPGSAPPPGFNPAYNPSYQPAGYAAYPVPPDSQPPPYSEYPAAGAPGFSTNSPRPEDKHSPSQSDMFVGSFSEKKIRMAFIRKVYLILMCQIFTTVSLVALFIFESNTKYFVQRNVWLYLVSYVVFLVTYLVLACCPTVRRKHPTNIIMLCIFTLALSFMVAMISCYHDTKIVFYSMGICAVVCLGITIFAIQTKFDFTLCGSFLFVAVLVLFVFGIIAIFTRDRIVNLVYSALIALIFSLFLAYDTQQIIGGRRHEMSPEEYVFGALQLYLDVIYIFTAILSIFGNSK